jgi:hypothetical protein
MTVSVQQVSIYNERRVAIAFNGTETGPIPYHRGWFHPEGIIIIYSKPNNSAWEVTSAEVYGPKLRINGARSSVEGKIYYYPGDVKPEWVRNFIAQYLPST